LKQYKRACLMPAPNIKSVVSCQFLVVSKNPGPMNFEYYFPAAVIVVRELSSNV
jgi:hypothetical protein